MVDLDTEKLADKVYNFFGQQCGVQLPKKRKKDLERMLNNYFKELSDGTESDE